jgi:rhamnose utilization protein RhaD (predicted bifunctional aldolase and dehydrogenase)
LSSSSSSSDDRLEFCELVRWADEARQCYSNATHEVSRLERYLDTVRVALEASKRETAAMQAATANA